MALKVRSLATAVKNFTDRGAAAGPLYQAGVQGAGATWQANSSAANQTWKDGVNAAAGRDAYATGITKAGPGKYQDKASTIGAQRFPDGIRKGATYYQTAVGPYLDVLSNLNLPPRRIKGDPSNINRVAAVNTALRAKKVGG